MVCFLQSYEGEDGGCVPPQECVAAWKQVSASVWDCDMERGCAFLV